MQEIGLQLYSVRDAMKHDLPGTVEKVAKMGYKAVEFAGFYGYSAKDIKKIVDDNGLKIFGTHTGLGDLTDDKLNQTMDYMHEIDNTHITLPSAPIGSKKQQKKTIERINYLQPILEKNGFVFSYHNHSSEFQKKLFTPSFYPQLLEKTNINLEVDTFWAFNAGNEPVAMLNQLKDRIRLIHLKDGFKKSKGKGAEGMSLGQGEAPVREVLKCATELGYLIVVESETQKPDGISEVQRCIDFLKTLK